MRIFFASPKAAHSWAYSGRIWHRNLADALRDLGHEVIFFRYDLDHYVRNMWSPEFVSKYRPCLENELRRQVEKASKARQLDMIFCYFWSACCRSALIEELKEDGPVLVNWYCNAAHQFDLVREIAPAFDWCLVPERARLEDYRRIGARPIYCQEAANPKFYRSYDVKKLYDVTFVGSRYGDRPQWLQGVRREGIDVRIWGSGWASQKPTWRMRLGRWRRKMLGRPLPPKEEQPDSWPLGVANSPLPDKSMVKLFSQSRINLGLSTCGDTQLEKRIIQVRLRDFEIPMSGGFYITEHSEELTEFFRPGEEVITYTDLKDLVDKCRYYLAHEDERERIRVAAYQRAITEHTWQARLSRAFAEMGL